jgi:hypothetical protein
LPELKISRLNKNTDVVCSPEYLTSNSLRMVSENVNNEEASLITQSTRLTLLVFFQMKMDIAAVRTVHLGYPSLYVRKFIKLAVG